MQMPLAFAPSPADLEDAWLDLSAGVLTYARTTAGEDLEDDTPDEEAEEAEEDDEDEDEEEDDEDEDEEEDDEDEDAEDDQA